VNAGHETKLSAIAPASYLRDGQFIGVQLGRSHHAAGLLPKQNAGLGDHHLKVNHEPDYYFPVRLGIGDAVVFGSWTVHASGMNTASEPRYGDAAQFFRHGTVAHWPDGQWSDLMTSPRHRTSPVETIDPNSY